MSVEMKNKSCVNTDREAKLWEIYYSIHDAAMSILIRCEMRTLLAATLAMLNLVNIDIRTGTVPSATVM